jgi:putative spermidine/putrescine transport system permease protein
MVSAAFALAFALLFRNNFAGRKLSLFLFQLNLTIPHLVGALGVLYLLSQSGTFARIAASAGMLTTPQQFPALVFDPWSIAIITQYVWKETPFITLMLLASLQTTTTDYEQAARNLGANWLQSMRHIVLPALAPSLAWSSTIVFAFTFGAFEVPLLLGASQPQALAVLAYRKYADVDLAARPDAMVIAIFTAIICIGVSFAMRGFRKQT